jgi:demethylmenaquinone methyltransferase/2-methoxy-6-polyprenyl-1,4-benzoquinol methylase
MTADPAPGRSGKPKVTIRKNGERTRPTPMDKALYVRDMFAAIAPRYDATNRLLTAGADEAWRKRAISLLAPPPGGTLLDLCCGTGDLSFHLAKHDRALRIVGVDFCGPMLDGARRRAVREDPACAIDFVEADVMQLPYADHTFDGATMGFAMRNVVDIEATLREVRRVLKPGARFVNLDVSKVRSPLLRRAFNLYFYGLVPLIGGLVGGSKSAYRYLPNSLTNYPDADELAARFRRAGFRDVGAVRLGFGAVAIHHGVA